MGQLRSLNKYLGFTLLELVLVIVIIGILSAVALPKFVSITSFTNKTFSDEVLSSVRYAQKIAIAMSCEVQVSITATQLTLNLRQNCTTGNFNLDLRDPGLGSSSYVKTAPSSIVISSNDFPIYFDRLGRVRDSATNNITDANLSIGSYNLQIVGETGFIYEI